MPTATLMLAALLASPTTLLQRPADSLWGVEETSWGALAAGSGALLGGAVGFFSGIAVGPDCDGKFGCSGDDTRRGMVGALSLSHVGAVAGVAIYGGATDLDGSALGALGGSLVGQLGGGLIALGMCSADERLCGAAVGVALLTQALGASIGYGLMVDGPTDGPVAHGGLLDYDPAHGLRLSAPSGGLSPGRDGEYTLGLTLAAGRF